MDGFNHVIVAIPPAAPTRRATLSAVINHPQLGKPAALRSDLEMTPLGSLPEYLQNNELLVVTPEGGTVIHVAPPDRKTTS